MFITVSVCCAWCTVVSDAHQMQKSVDWEGEGGTFLVFFLFVLVLRINV